ncbi:helix-turn-helix transcriptional regulator [Arsenicitalea aurantiaca]|uniref:helix-turn-helix transcriptional regulator n=1 Tax=Arsenicitalea aurantiaca TaxID=1783274 RepID=UPI001315A3DD|nr:AraC family transcriptional regulator [Arsenicitalea aurantiaca]
MFGQQPTFSGADFAATEIAYFGYVQFRSAVATSDSWERHEGMELVLVRSGEACWELPDNRLLRVSGGHGVLFPPHHRHRIVNGVYTPCQLFWAEFHPQEAAVENARLIPAEDIAAVYELARLPTSPIRFDDSLMRNLGALCGLLSDDDVLLGSRMLNAEIRAKIYALFIDFWKMLSDERSTRAVSPIVRNAELLLQEEMDRDEDIDTISRRLGCRKSYLYQLFRQEVGMAPNDYRQRLRIKRSCDQLAQTDAHITDIAMHMGYSSSQYFSRVFKKYVGVTPKSYRAWSRGQA